MRRKKRRRKRMRRRRKEEEEPPLNEYEQNRLKNIMQNEEARRELDLVFGVENNVLLNIPGGKKKATGEEVHVGGGR